MYPNTPPLFSPEALAAHTPVGLSLTVITDDTGIKKGDVLVITGTRGEIPKATLCDASDSSLRGMMLMATHDQHPDLDEIVCCLRGILIEQDTSALIAGQPVFVGDNGRWTATPPASAAPALIFGYVLNVSATEGSILFGGGLDLGKRGGSVNKQLVEAYKVTVNIATGNGTYLLPIPSGVGNAYLLENVRVICGATDAGGEVVVQDEAGQPITTTAIPCDTQHEVQDSANLHASRIGITPDTTLSVIYSGGSANGRGTVILTLIPRSV